MKSIKKYLALILVVLVLVFQVFPVVAIEPPAPPTPPPAPIAPSAPSAPLAPSQPTPPPAPEQPVTPDPTSPPNLTPTPAPIQQVSPSSSPSSVPNETQTTDEQQQNTVAQPSPSPANTNTTQQTGDTQIKTGDSNNTNNILTTGNNNLSNLSSNNSGGTSIINSNNGSNSTNTGSVVTADNFTTVQGNIGDVKNILNQSSVTGGNSANDNVGSSVIKTGDANVTGTVVTHLNTNIDGVSVSEFNISDDHTGDFILDFNNNCISGCDNFSNALLVNAGNGSGSQNSTNLTDVTNQNTFQNNDGTVESNLILSADSGHNTANRNTGSSSFIETGDANVAANALAFVNNNLAGNVLYGIVNVFGTLVGDIILPERVFGQVACQNCNSDTTLANINNGTSSNNNVNTTSTTDDTVFQTNTAEIENNLLLTSTSGSNDVNKNTGGTAYVNTGNTSTDAKVLNIANSNVAGGNWWLVIVNEAGKWLGKILDAPEGSNFAGSSGTQFTVNENGEITAINEGNGANSTNNTNLTQVNNNTVVQTNTAKVTNNLNLSANTGKNQASLNTGGDSVIKTGDANILANLVNFVNNNISGGKLLVTVVNVFGSWKGDFVTPGNKKPSPIPSAIPEVQSPSPSPVIEEEEPIFNPTTGSVEDEEQVIRVIQQPTTSGQSNTAQGGAGIFIPTQVAGFVTEVQSIEVELPDFPFTGKGKTPKKVKINLAWLVLILPVGALGYVAFKRFSKSV